MIQVQSFRKKIIREFTKLKLCWPTLECGYTTRQRLP